MAADLRRIEELLEQILENQSNQDDKLDDLASTLNTVAKNQRLIDSEIKKLATDITRINRNTR